MSRMLLLLLAALAALTVLLAPATAEAQLAGQCIVMRESGGAPPPSAASAADDEAEGWLCRPSDGEKKRVGHHEIPICLEEGASAVAPLPLLPTDGARAEATEDCDDQRTADQWAAGSPEERLEQRHAPPDAVVPHGRLTVVAGAAQPLEHACTAGLSGPPGVRPGVFRPPRR